jgi:hypothetical protein
MRFLDLSGRQYAIPEAVLAEFEVKGELPDIRLTGLELPPASTSADVDGYSWKIQDTERSEALEYVVCPSYASVEQPVETQHPPGKPVVLQLNQLRVEIYVSEGFHRVNTPSLR